MREKFQFWIEFLQQNILFFLSSPVNHLRTPQMDLVTLRRDADHLILHINELPSNNSNRIFCFNLPFVTFDYFAAEIQFYLMIL